MSVDASAIARVVGIETTYEDLRAGQVVFLPQRLLLIAQGSSASSYSTTKFTAESALQVGNIAGFGSPAHLCMKEFYPDNGDGIGTIQVDVCLLEDAGGSSAAVGDVTPSGTASIAAGYKARVSGILGQNFTIPAGAIDVTDTCRKIGQSIAAVAFMPLDISYTYGTVAAVPDAGNTGDGTVTALSADTGLPGDWRLVCNTAGVDDGIFTLTDPEGSVISTTLAATLTPGTDVDIGGIQFTLMAGAADYIVGDGFTITVPATDVQATSKWQGESANDILIEIIDTLGDLTFAITQPTGGTGNPTVDAALAQVGGIWNTMGLNALNIEDTTALDAYDAFGEGRWGELVRKPIVFFTGVAYASRTAATAISSTRTTDRTNAQLVGVGSPNLPCVIAARQLARIVKLANNNPPHDYGSQRANGLIPGTDGEQWDYPARDAAVKAGSSTIEIKGGVINVSDVVTFYAPAGDPSPAYRYVVDIVKLQNCIFNTDLIFANTDWDGAPLIPDDQATVNPDARKPSGAKADLSKMLDGLGAQAIISDPKAAKKSIVANISSSNPKRLDTEVTFALAGNANIISHTQKFGFFFGSSE